MSSANGKGRTLYEILTGKNQKDTTPLEFQYHNPLNAKISSFVEIDHVLGYEGINFSIEEIAVYKTTINGKNFYHTDYRLKGKSLNFDFPIRLCLRLMPDKDLNNELKHKIQLLNIYDEFEWDENFYNYLEKGDQHEEDKGHKTFTCQDEGSEEFNKYWRVDAVSDSYQATQTLLIDNDNNGIIEDNELEHNEISYWDFSRLTTNPETGEEYIEYIWIEMNNEYCNFSLSRGRDILPFQVSIY